MRIKTPYNQLMAQYRSKRRFWRGAAVHYQRLVDAGSKDYKLKYKLVDSLYKSKQYERATETIDRFLKSHPKDQAMLAIKARSLIKLEQCNEALRVAKKLHGLDGKDHTGCILYGDVLFLLGEYNDAAQYYDKALTIKEDSYAYHSLGRIAELSGSLEKADNYYKKAIDMSSSKKVKLLGVGALHQARGWTEAALAAYKLSLEKEPDNSELYFQIGKLYSKLLKNREAAEAYKKFVEHDQQLGEEHHKLDKDMIVFDSFLGRNYSCSPRAIYEFMAKDPKYRHHKFVWVFRSSSISRYWKFYLNPRVKVVRYKSRNYFRAYARAKYWVTNSRLAFVLKTNDDQVYLQCWHGTALKRIGHSIIDNTQGTKHDKASLVDLYDQDTKKIDYFLSTSKSATESFEEAFQFKRFGKTVLETGYPRNDYLVNVTSSQIQKTKQRFNIPKNKKVLLYAPTWRDDQHDSERGFTYKTHADFDYLRDKLGDDWIILFRAHYFIANTFNFQKYDGFLVDVSDVDEINDLYVISNVLMTDYSSVFFDYANLRRPIIFFMYDLEHYQNDLRGFYLDLKELPGEIVKTEPAIVRILGDLDIYNKAQAKTYQDFHDKFNYLDDGKAAERVVERVFESK